MKLLLQLCRAYRYIAQAALLVSIGGPTTSVAAQAPPVQDSGIVRHVTGEDRGLAWRLETEWRLSGSGNASVLLSSVIATDLAALPGGGLALLDRLARKVYVINARGVVVDSIGRHGRGPGELSRPASIALDAEGHISVMDRDKGAFVRWSASTRELVSELPGPSVFVGTGVRIVSGHHVYKVLRMEGGSRATYLLVRATNGDVQTLAQSPVVELREATFQTCGAQLTGAPIFAPDLPWAARGSRIAVAADDLYIVDVFYDGQRTMRIARDVQPRTATRAHAVQHAEGRRIGSCTIPAVETVRGFGHATTIPAVAGIQLTPSGDLWILRGGIAGERRRIDVFSGIGQYRGTVSEVPFPAEFLDEDRFVAIETDNLGVPTLTAYRIVRR